MTRPHSDLVRRLEVALANSAGGYLRNTIREPGVTCVVCSIPVEARFQRCVRCEGHARSGLQLGDRVASMVYAVKPQHGLDQTYTAMRGYKAATPVPAYEQLVQALLALGLKGHADCDLRLSGRDTHQWAVVPSTREPAREHPLHRLVLSLARTSGGEVPVGVRPGADDYRQLDPSNYVVDPHTVVPGGHVLVIDDSWVQGAHAQSVSAALRRAGAASVSILTVARVVDPNFGPNPGFIRARLLGADYDPARCPWTGGDCP